MNKTLIFNMFFIILFGCDRVLIPITDNSAHKDFNLGDTISVAYHQTVVNDTEDLSIRFKELIGDSRCPMDVVCFWQGDADILFTLNTTDESKDFNLHTAWVNKRDTTLLDYHITLVDVKPYLHTEFEYRPEQYEAYVVVTHN